jgi:AcrR family transcriptional regulator
VQEAQIQTKSSKTRGRPRRVDVDERVLEATVGLLNERGIAGTTLAAAVDHSGVSRATVYRRWPNRAALIGAAVRHAMRRPQLAPSGDLATDIRRGFEGMRAIFSAPGFRSILPTVLLGIATEPNRPLAIPYDVVAPGRLPLAQIYDRDAPSQGFRTDVDGELVMDIIIGTVMNHVLATREVPTSAECGALADILIRGLRTG